MPHDRGGNQNADLSSPSYEDLSSESVHQKHLEDNSRLLRRNYWSVAYFTLQSTLLLLAWGITCAISKKPIPYQKYDISLSEANMDCSTLSEGSRTNFGCDSSSPLMSASQLVAYDGLRYAVRVIGAISAILTIPLSSATCARAAVVYTQKQRDVKFRLRETIALADRGWWDLYVLTRVFLPYGIGRYGSLFLLFCTAVCTLGMPPLLLY
jgi:hypothetical protein